MGHDEGQQSPRDRSGIPPVPRGVPQIQMTFDIDANGILNVSTVDESTVKQNKITITNNKSSCVRAEFHIIDVFLSGRLSKKDIERMVKEAEEFKNEDEIQKDRITAKNALESYAYNMKSTMEGEKLKDNISDSDKKLVDEKVKT